MENKTEDKTSDDIIQNLKNTASWKRLLFMALFFVTYTIAEFAIWVVILFLIFFNLFMGSSNERALLLGRQLSAYIYHMLLYLTYNTEERPFPYTDWPSPGSAPMDPSPVQKAETATATKENYAPEGNGTVRTE